eukprot:757742-Hanusia_phi.AAC.1
MPAISELRRRIFGTMSPSCTMLVTVMGLSSFAMLAAPSASTTCGEPKVMQETCQVVRPGVKGEGRGGGAMRCRAMVGEDGARARLKERMKQVELTWQSETENNGGKQRRAKRHGTCRLVQGRRRKKRLD